MNERMRYVNVRWGERDNEEAEHFVGIRLPT
jgi:hypothetical protein